jgi:hypothetical protein
MPRLSHRDVGLCAQTSHGIDGQWEATKSGRPMPAADQHAVADFASDNPQAVVLNLVQPQCRIF